MPREALLLTPVTPAASGNGLTMRAGLLLDSLSRSFDVRSVVVPVFGASPPDAFVSEHAASFAILDLPSAHDAVADLRVRLSTPAGRRRVEALHPRPVLCRRATLEAASTVASVAQRAALVVVHRLYLAPFLDELLDRDDRPPIVLDVDDDDAAVHARAGEADESAAYERLAREYLPGVAHVLTASRMDTARFTALLSGRPAVTTAPNAVRLPEAPFDTAGVASRHDLVFVGNLSYRPNIDAAAWLCREVLPLLPDVTVALVGSNPSDAVAAHARDPRVTVAASVPNVSPWYAASKVAVVPLHSGGGTPIKLVEALVHRRPVVATPFGAAGVDLVPERDGLTIAADAAGFARACRDLLDDPSRADALAAAGHDAVARTLTADIVAGDLDRRFRSLAGVGQPAARAIPLARQVRLNRLAADVCARLSDAGARAILLKGPTFGVWLYRSAVERSCRDIDILVDPAAEPVAARVLTDLGFREYYGRSKAMVEGRPAVAWVRGGDCIDLHRGRFWGIGVPGGASWDLLSAHTERLEIAGRSVEALDVTARVLHVAVHAAASGGASTRPLEDLRRATVRVPIEIWRGAARRAVELKAEGAFADGLRRVPRGATIATQLGLDEWTSFESLLCGERPPPLASGLARLIALPGTRAKLATIVRTVVPTPSYLSTRVRWARRSVVHTAAAYPVWLGVIARRSFPALVAVGRAVARARRS